MKNARRQNDLFLHIFKIYTNFLQKCTLGIFLKRIFSTGFTIYCFHFLVVHTVYALQKCHCISKIHLEIFRSKDSKSTLTCIFLVHKKADPTDRILLTIYVKQYIGIKMHCQCAFLRSNSCKNPILPLFLLLCYCHSCTRIPCVYCV